MVRDVIVCVLVVFVNVCGSLKCKSHTGQPVDWFTVYKLPEIHDVGIDKWSYDGVGFYYMDSNSPSWKLSSIPFNATGHSVEYTLRQIYKNTTNEYMYAMYNDQPPTGHTSLNHGHTKGVYAFDKSEGFWLIMSIPHFPPPRSSGFSYPDSGKVYGQSIFCVSLQYSAIESVAKIMTFTYPKFYDHYLPPSFSSENPITMSVLSGSQKHVTSPPFQLETTLHTTDGVVLHNFAKSTDFEKDLYDAFLAPVLQETFFVETWQNGPRSDDLPSNCSLKFQVSATCEVEDTLFYFIVVEVPCACLTPTHGRNTQTSSGTSRRVDQYSDKSQTRHLKLETLISILYEYKKEEHQPGLHMKMPVLFDFILWTLWVTFSGTARGEGYTNGITCQGIDRQPVDWFIVYKTPKDPQNKNKLISEGVAFYYMDSHRPAMTLSPTPIDKEGHALYNTLQQIYLNYFMVEYGMYNDQPPGSSNKTWKGPENEFGHTKGVYAFDKQTGFWLISSIPKFPPPKNKGYAFNKLAQQNGQLAVCVTLNTQELVNLRKIFGTTQPQIYDGKGPETLMPPMQPSNESFVLSMYTHDSMQLMCSAKSSLYEKDLYDSLVAPSLSSDVLVQSFHTGIPSSCSTVYKVINVSKIKFPDTNIYLSGQRDHAKWAVSEKLGRWVCIGDLNRSTYALKRRGGALCMANYTAWKAFIVYKLPKNKSNRNPLIKQGVGFYYMDSENPSFSLSDADIQKEGHALYNTLQQVYKQNGPQKFKYAMYNDQPPLKPTDISEESFKKYHLYGHTKGMYAFDEKQGFWLISSVPKFPAPLSHNYSYEQEQTKLGQAMICVSLSRKYLTVIEDIFNITDPNIYDPKRGPRRHYSHVTLVPYKVFPISTVKGQRFRFFAKSSIFGKDLYDGLVAPELRESLYVHTWEPNLTSACNMEFKVMNIEIIKFSNVTEFKSNSDHSKWIVSKDDFWVCVGDINRKTTQFKRGGGTICLSSESVWRAFTALMKSVKTCTRNQ
ncbi:uncharacterized protein LOC134247711 [Saccostrea cucullata]|uniref:uncharacterized protein LOC134247711 n=1 Tax=Saccostrea cuccullata TaxID=36930 RepID=UPI002ED5A8D9